VVLLAGLSVLGEAERDAWFAQRGVNRAEVRAWVRPYAVADWIKNWPHYAEGLHNALLEHEFIVSKEMAGLEDDPAFYERKLEALNTAEEKFAQLTRLKIIDRPTLRWHRSRLAVERAEAVLPKMSQLWFLPEINNPIYSYRAPVSPVGGHLFCNFRLIRLL
jgi:hypothetical protein